MAEPKQDRSRATRQRLVDATIDTLASAGWQATTVAVVAERAGVSRGAAQHHFPTREDLITAALDAMFRSLIEIAEHEVVDGEPGPAHTEAVVSVLVEYYCGPMFKAALQIWTAAAADPALRARIVPLEERFGREAYRAALRVLGVTGDEPGVRHMVAATLDLGRGLGLADVLTDDSQRRGAVVRGWARQVHAVLVEAGVAPAAGDAYTSR